LRNESYEAERGRRYSVRPAATVTLAVVSFWRLLFGQRPDRFEQVGDGRALFVRELARLDAAQVRVERADALHEILERPLVAITT
jgi:hypothetical protein